jgi:hypothetical protein
MMLGVATEFRQNFVNIEFSSINYQKQNCTYNELFVKLIDDNDDNVDLTSTHQ